MSRADIIFTVKLGLVTATLILVLWALNAFLS